MRKNLLRSRRIVAAVASIVFLRWLGLMLLVPLGRHCQQNDNPVARWLLMSPSLGLRAKAEILAALRGIVGRRPTCGGHRREQTNKNERPYELIAHSFTPMQKNDSCGALFSSSCVVGKRNAVT